MNILIFPSCIFKRYATLLKKSKKKKNRKKNIFQNIFESFLVNISLDLAFTVSLFHSLNINFLFRFFKFYPFFLSPELLKALILLLKVLILS